MSDKKKTTEITMFDASEIFGWANKSEEEKDAIAKKVAERIKATLLAPKDSPSE